MSGNPRTKECSILPPVMACNIDPFRRRAGSGCGLIVVPFCRRTSDLEQYFEFNTEPILPVSSCHFHRDSLLPPPLHIPETTKYELPPRPYLKAQHIVYGYTRGRGRVHNEFFGFVIGELQTSEATVFLPIVCPSLYYTISDASDA